MTFERYTAFLTASNLRYQLVTHEPVRTITDVRTHIPTLLPTMVKTIVFEISGEQLVLVAVCGADRVDYKKLAAYFAVNRRKVTTLSPERVSAELQVQPGGVAPIPLSTRHLLIIDQAASQLPLIHTGSGKFTETLAIEPSALIAATNAIVLDVVK